MLKERFEKECLCQDPIHGYIAFSSSRGNGEECSERDLIDSPWIQRLRHIHQLQTAWWVYPVAEHSRFQHVLGTMHLASRVFKGLQTSFFESIKLLAQKQRDSLASKKMESSGQKKRRTEEDLKLPSPEYVELLLRLAGLLHDVGHGPFGHFFDSFFLSQFKTEDGQPLTHEIMGAEIIRRELAPMLRKIRRSPSGAIREDEEIDPEQIAYLIVRPREIPEEERRQIPFWLDRLRTLFSGVYTVDNMDFVLRDAYMTGFGEDAFDIQRLLHYSFFTEKGLTIHRKGVSTLTRFLRIRAELFRSVYFHRTVRAIDLMLAELFKKSRDLLYPFGNPLMSLNEYRRFTEWSLTSDVAGWERAADSRRRELAKEWNNYLERRVPYRLLAERTVIFKPEDNENTSIFSDPDTFERFLRNQLPEHLKNIIFSVDIARHLQRPDVRRQSAQNFLYDPENDAIVRLESESVFSSLSQSFRIIRVYAETTEYQTEVFKALDSLTQGKTQDNLTNM